MSGASAFSLPVLAALLLVGLTLVAAQSDDTVKRRTGNTCMRDGDCPDNAFCKPSEGRGYCLCKENHIIHLFNSTHRECLKEATDYGDACRVDIQCQSRMGLHAECWEQKCRCKQGTHYEDNRCYPTALIGEKCTVSQNCYLGPDDVSSHQAYCVRGLCECNLLHSPRDGGTRCLKDAMLGSPCEDDEHCTGENERCNNVCRCKEGHVEHSDEHRCLRAVTAFNESCEIDAQCTKFLNGTSCIGFHCVCLWNHHLRDGKCWNTKYMGERCSFSQECLTEDNEPGRCVRNVCTCPGCKSGKGGGDGNSASSNSGFLIIYIFVSLATVAIGIA